MKSSLVRFLMGLFLFSVAFSPLQASSKTMDDGYHFTSYFGGAYNAPTTLRVYLDEPAGNGQKDIKKYAKWRNKPFHDSVYYAVRVEKWKNNKGRGIEFIHHKAYLSNINPGDGIEDFSISDGYNLLYHNWAWTWKQNISRFGLGLVFGNPDITFTGRDPFHMDGGINGSYLSGVTAQLGLERWLHETDKNFVSFETKLTASLNRTPVSTDFNEFADVHNFALHFLIGIGSKPMQDRSKESVAWYFLPPGLMHLVGHLTPTDA